MADDEKKKTGGYGVGAFASMVHTQQRYIVFNLNCVDYDTDHKLTGASRYLPHAASHELFHTLGFDHPRSNASSGEAVDSRDWDQVKRDIASNLTSNNALGKVDKSGRRIITYSYGADPTLTPHGDPRYSQIWANDPNAIPVEKIANLKDGKDEARNKSNASIKSVMKEAFAEHERLFNVKYEEATDPSSANLLIYAAEIPTRPQPSFELTRGRQNAYTHDVTIMTYTQADRAVYPLSAVGDIKAAQEIYGLPPEDASRRVVTTQRLADHSGVLWDHKPLAIKLTDSPKVGSLTIDMGAHPYKPVIVGVLKDEQGNKQVRQHLGDKASIGELDATGSDLSLDVTSANDASIKTGNRTTVRLNGRRSEVALGAPPDTLVHQKGFGHVVTGLGKDDSLAANGATKARLQAWDDKDGQKGTLVTFIGKDDKATGSVFVKDAQPDVVAAHLKGVEVVKPKEPDALTLNGVDKDSELGTSGSVMFNEANNVIVSSKKAAGMSVDNRGAGSIIVKMTQPEYDSRSLQFHQDGNYYALKYRDETGQHTMHLRPTSHIAITDPEGKVRRVVGIADAKKEIDLDIALKKGLETPFTPERQLAALPARTRSLEEQLG